MLSSLIVRNDRPQWFEMNWCGALSSSWRVPHTKKGDLGVHRGHLTDKAERLARDMASQATTLDELNGLM
jgi:hypothetical protein